MPDAIWIDRREDLEPLAALLENRQWIGLDTEFLREKTFFPKLCLLQIAAAGRIWCIDTLSGAGLEPLAAALTSPSSRKVIHAARQDLEAVYLTSRRIIAPVFDTQVAAACIGLKPQVGYAELVKVLLDVTLVKGQTRTDWSKRPLSHAQLLYAAEDVLYLEELAVRLSGRPRIALRSRSRACTSRIRRSPGRVCAVSHSLRPSRAHAQRRSRSGANARRANAICRAPGSFPTRQFSTPQRATPRP